VSSLVSFQVATTSASLVGTGALWLLFRFWFKHHSHAGRSRLKVLEAQSGEVNVFPGGLVLPVSDDPRWTGHREFGFQLGDITVEYRGVTPEHVVLSRHSPVAVEHFRWCVFIKGEQLSLPENRANEYGRSVYERFMERRSSEMATAVQHTIEDCDLPGRDTDVRQPLMAALSPDELERVKRS
jgi:hypothetical protein